VHCKGPLLGLCVTAHEFERAFTGICGRVRVALTRATAMRGQTSSTARAKRDTRSGSAPKPQHRNTLVSIEEPNRQRAGGCVASVTRWSPVVDVVGRSGFRLW